MKQRLLVICGATASGKSAIAIEICKQMGGEVVSADSMQIYEGMSVLTAAPTRADMLYVPHHLVGFVPPSQSFSASAYGDIAKRVINDIFARGGFPVLCGGTGLYIDAVTKGMRFSEKADTALREHLKAQASTPDGAQRLHAYLEKIDPESARRFPAADVRRVIRSIEIYELTGMTRGEQERLDARSEGDYDALLFAPDIPRQALYQKIEARVDYMINNGALDEVRRLMEQGDISSTAWQAIGLRDIASALNGERALEGAINDMKTASRNYAKRQLTWFRRDARVNWIPAHDKTATQIAAEIVRAFGARAEGR